MFERFTEEARAVVVRSADRASSLRDTATTTGHVLLAILDQARIATEQLGVSADSLVRAVVENTCLEHVERASASRQLDPGLALSHLGVTVSRPLPPPVMFVEPPPWTVEAKALWARSLEIALDRGRSTVDMQCIALSGLAGDSTIFRLTLDRLGRDELTAELRCVDA